MRILFLSDNFPPEVNAPASRTFEHCRLWAAAGDEVTVITCAPNFPHGRVYVGYRNRLWQWEDMQGVRVLRVATYMAANEGFAPRILDYLSFMFASFLGSFLTGPADVVVGTSPQFFTACAAWAVSVCKLAPFIFELRDLWPESIRAVGAMKDGVVLRALERVELFLYRRAAAVVSVTNSFKANLIRRGIAPGKIHVITNGVELDRFQPRERDAELVRELGLEGKFVAGYIGTHGLAHGLDTLLDAAEHVKSAPGGEQVTFLFLGDGADKVRLKARAAERGLSNARFVDSVSKEEVARYWSLLDASIIHLRGEPVFQSVIPSKLFECMGMGVPILLGVEGEAAELLESAGAGEAFKPEDSTALASAVLRVKNEPAAAEQWRRQGPVAARRYDRAALAQKMRMVLEAVSS